MPSTIRPLSVVPAPDPSPSELAGPTRAVAAAPDPRRSDRHPTTGPSARPRPGATARVAPGGSTTALQFSEAVRTVIAVAHRHRLRPPVFRSPPALDGVDRTIRRRAGVSAVVAVRRAGRPVAAVRADVVEGVVAANALDGAGADRFRHAAWAALDPAAGRSGPAAGGDIATSAAATRAQVSTSELDEVA